MMGTRKSRPAAERHALLLLFAFAISLAALAVAGVGAWARCGRGSDCTPELALGVVAAGPAAFIGVLVILLTLVRVDSRALRTALLAVGAGVAVLPLAVFFMQDPWLLAAAGGLVVAAMVLALLDARVEAESEAAAPDGTPWLQAAEPKSPGAVLASDTADTSTMELLGGMAEVNRGVIRLCERLERLSTAPRAPGHRIPPDRSRRSRRA